jgi:hypothetical protein
VHAERRLVTGIAWIVVMNLVSTRSSLRTFATGARQLVAPAVGDDQILGQRRDDAGGDRRHRQAEISTRWRRRLDARGSFREQAGAPSAHDAQVFPR